MKFLKSRRQYRGADLNCRPSGYEIQRVIQVHSHDYTYSETSGRLIDSLLRIY
jgi:hypothetical protein